MKKGGVSQWLSNVWPVSTATNRQLNGWIPPVILAVLQAVCSMVQAGEGLRSSLAVHVR